MYLGRRSLTIALHTSFVMRLTDALEIPNNWPIVRKSALLAKYQSVSALALLSIRYTDIYKKVFRYMQKFVSQSSGVKVVPIYNVVLPYYTSVSDPYSSCGHEQVDCAAAEQQSEHHS